MKVAIVIPARFGSCRLPGKPLLRQTGKYLIEHVYERACETRCADQVVIATDDPRVRAAAQHFGAPCVMTRRSHVNGTERVAEVAASLRADIIINLQGDEPLIEPADIVRLAEQMTSGQVVMATLAAPIRDLLTYQDPNCVKVVRADDGRALYFSRAPIPFFRDGSPTLRTTSVLQHIGIYAYRRDFLMQLVRMPMHELETLEKLEQLRVLARGFPIQVALTDRVSRGVDTYDDYRHFVKQFRDRNRVLAA
jgi:3-deoxy-manno-octulosonate cytidylyltransferase (CMP-KDO synthetase)